MASPMRVQTPHVTFDVSAAGAFSEMFARAPGLTFAAVRFAVFRMMAEHRKTWLQKADVKFRSGGIRAAQIDDRRQTGGGTFDVRRTVFYKVFPGKIDRNTPPKDTPKLDAIRGEIFTTSQIALGLEQGGTFRARSGSKFLALPIGVTKDSLGRTKSKWNTPERFARGGKELVPVPRRTGSGYTLFWKRTRGRGQGKRVELVPAFRLVPQVRRIARFKLMETWEGLGGFRTLALREAGEFITQRMKPVKAAS